MLSFNVTQQDHCRRLESYIRALMPFSPSGYTRKLIKNGAARLNGTQAAPDTVLAFNDIVTLKESSATTNYLIASRPALDILYEDSRLVIVNKPAGLAMHRTAEQDDDLVTVGETYMEMRATPCKLYPVNRLDRGTSGTVIMAKSSSSAGIYGRQVKEAGLDKLYLALVAGFPDTGGVINTPLDGKESETRYRILLEGAHCSLLAVSPVSGRMHQIRRHLALIGHPVLADKRYGGGELPEFAGFALHSFRTKLILETSGALTVCAPVTDALLTLCEQRKIERTHLLKRCMDLATCR